jgi:broad specificity phosphatase PhoE
MIKIYFEIHGLSINNEKHLASGHYDSPLSERGVLQAKALGEKYKNVSFDAIFTSDLKRAYDAALIAFDSKTPILRDKRLRECNYGDLTNNPNKEVKALQKQHIKNPFPHGESYEQVCKRVEDFLIELKKDYRNRKILIIAHRGVQFSLDHLVDSIPFADCFTLPWDWNVGKIYELK